MSAPTEITWQEPPASRHDRWAPIADALRSNPGAWALVDRAGTGGGACAAHIKQGRLAAFRPAGSFETTVRSVGKDDAGHSLFDVYARYVGTSDGGASA